MDDGTIAGLFAGAYAAVTGAYGWLLRHSKDHVSRQEIDRLKSGVVYRDTCRAEKEKNTERYETLLREIKTTQNMIKGCGQCDGRDDGVPSGPDT